jgi:allantoinase
VRVFGGRVFTPEGPRELDVVIDGGRIASLEPASAAGDLDARGLWVLPGGVDAHVHGRDPGFPEKEDFASLTEAAAAGGVTTVLDMPNTLPCVADGDVLTAKREAVADKAHVDFGLWGILRHSSSEDDLRSLAAAGAVGIKAYLGYAVRRSTGEVVYTPAALDPDLEPPASYGALARLGEVLADIGLPVAAHAEDPSILIASARRVESYADLLAARPDVAEAVAVAALGALGRRYGLRLHIVHLASAAGVSAVRASGATVEATPTHLLLTDADFGRLGPAMKMYPLVRGRGDQLALRSALEEGLIDTLGSDHAPHTDLEKLHHTLSQAHAGSPGVQTLYLAALQLAGPERAAKLVAENPARIFGLAGKGRLEPGFDADLVLVDPAAKTEVTPAWQRSRQRHAALTGIVFDFAIRQVLLRGEPPAAGRGVFLRPGLGAGRGWSGAPPPPTSPARGPDRAPC